MNKPKLMRFEPLMGLTIAKYERYLPTAFDESLSLIEKYNKIIEYLNRVGQLTNDVVEQWNTVMEWIMNDGLNESVVDRINEMYEDGTLATIINDEIFSMKANRTELNDIALALSNFMVTDDPDHDIRVAFQTAYDTNTPLASSQDYEIDTNIPYFHEVKKIGTGSVKRGSDVFYFTPKGSQKNTIYVSDKHHESHDGLTSDRAVTMAKSIEIVKSLGEKATDGVWAIKIIGTITQRGVRPGTLPMFKERLIIEGERNEYGDITSIVDGEGIADAYWWRSDLHSSFKFLEFKNLKFVNWDSGVNAGAIVVWEQIDVYVHDCEFIDCSRGVWARSGRVQIDDCIFDRMRSAVSLQYHAHFNVSRNKFLNCTSSGCHQGRNSAGHFQDNEYENCYMDIDSTQSSRLRTITNKHKNWGLTAHNIGLNTTHEVADGQEDEVDPDSFEKGKPYQRLYYGGTAPKLTSGTHVGMHSASFPESLVTVREPGELNLGVQLGGRILQIPKNVLLDRGVHIQIILVASIGGNAEFDLILTGESRPGMTDEYVRFPVRMGNAGQGGKIVIDIFSARKGPGSMGFATIQFPHTDGVKSLYRSINFHGMNATVGPSIDQVIHRLWIDKISDVESSVTFAGYTTQIGVVGQ